MSIDPRVNKLDVRVDNLEKVVSQLVALMSTLEKDVKAKINTGELARSEARMEELIRDNSRLINDIQRQLALVVLPETSRYYLERSEVEDFRSNFNRLQAVLATVEQLHKNLVAYNAGLTQRN